MDNALEALDRGSSICALSDLANNPAGYSYQLGATINDIDPTITCTAVGGDINAVDAFAVIITGAGGQTGPLFRITNGGNSPQAQKVFEGPVYMGKPPVDGSTIDFTATLTIKEGDLWYSTTGTCPDPSVTLPGQLTITPAGYGTKCLEDDWATLFASRRPAEPNVDDTALFPVRASTAPAPDPDGCYVWPAGRYSSPPQLANQSYNYFASGDYYFSGMGTWTIGSAHVLMGYPGSTGPGIPGYKNNDTFASNPCNSAWTNDPNQTGSAVYMGGNSQIVLAQNSALEVSGSSHDGYNVGLQALETNGVPSTITGDSRIFLSGPGSNKQLAMNGLVWAPYAAFEFDLIANDAVAALTGGAVVSELVAGASANANNFVIRVDTQPSTTNFLFEATATNTGTTTVRTLLTYRSDRQYAVLSRRVQDLTPE